ncbi:hypothetical protein T12_10260 [Trichinella patagoniensis]|uniref:Uncharacterized protein n=1 Tax=Trichinella patagoniensis TaxID=990121 RepID=A0A0V0ZRP0_9BILA|nr:hypothetical protein T12_10260 [Trichinella patagoniensis]
MRSKFGLNLANAELAIETYLEMNQQVLHLYGEQELRELSLWVTSCAACVIVRSNFAVDEGALQHFKESANKTCIVQRLPTFSVSSLEAADHPSKQVERY